MKQKSNSSIDKASQKDVFGEIMEKAGYDGKFQMIYNVVFVLGLSFFGSMVYMNLILALNVPDHWCHVPGREKTNYTMNEWRALTLPSENDNRGLQKFSTCKMYILPNSTAVQHYDYEVWNFTNRESVDCMHGYGYDMEWYKRTIVTQENWVCEKDLYVTNIFVISRATEVVGSLLLGQAGDTFGRRIVYYISVIFVTIGRGFSIISTSSFIMFSVTTAVAAIAVNSVFQSPLVVAMEISREDQRTNIAMLQSIGWSIGTTVMPLLFWWLRDWIPFMWVTTLPTAAVLLGYNYVIESPRWLISKRRFAEAIVQFQRIARINGKEFDMSEKELSELYCDLQEENVYGIASLFSAWRIARNTIIMGFSWCVVAVSYFTLLLFSSRMGGNPFLNFLLQSIVEIPAYIVGKYFGDTIGRRLTNSFSFLISGIVCIPVIYLATDEKHETLMMCLAAIIKFMNAVTFFVASLQALEVYPTCLRQTGLSLGVIFANAVGIVSPYLVYLGTTYDIRYPYYILAILFFVGGTSAIFLPETLHQKLPDTLEEGKVFGINQKFFSLPRVIPPTEEDIAAQEKLNQKKFAP